MGAPMSSSTTRTDVLPLLGARISELRRAAGLSQARLAEAIGVDVQTIQRAERAKVSLALSRVEQIAEALDVPVHVLFRGKGEPVPVAALTPEEWELLNEWRQVPEDLREMALRLVREVARESRLS